MIDSKGKVSLLEINHTPSFSTDTPLDELIKSNLIRDTVILMNITPESRDKTLLETKQVNQKRVFTGKTIKMTPQQRMAKVEELQKIREDYEKRNLGSFERIFPSKVKTKQDKYIELLDYSLRSYRDLSNGNRNRKSPTRFRVTKVLTSNQSFGEAEETREHLDERSHKKVSNRSQSVKSPIIDNLQGSPVLNILAKKVGFRTSNE